MLNNKYTPTLATTDLKLNKDDCSNNVDPTFYKSMVGSGMYLTTTRPDIMYAVSLISKFRENPKETHLQEQKRILMYVNGTKSHGILYIKTNNFELVGYIDNDWGGNIDDRKSTFGYVFQIGLGAISWASKKQLIVSPPTPKPKYVATNKTTCQVVWLRRILLDLN
jgi:hypothetical protein